MATPIEDGQVQGDTGPEVGTGETPGLNPAWSEALSAIPEGFHPTLTEHFQKWDQSAQNRIEAVNKQLEAYSGYKDFVEHGVTAEELANGYQLLSKLNTNPQEVYEALKNAFGYDSEEVESEEGEEEETPTFQDPRFDQLQQGVELVAQTLVQQEEAKVAAKADADLDAEISSLKEKYPHLDEGYVLSVVAASEGNISLEQAAQKFDQMAQSILQQNPRPFAPTVMGNSGGGTGLPSQAIDPTKLDGKERRNLVAEMTRRMMAE